MSKISHHPVLLICSLLIAWMLAAASGASAKVASVSIDSVVSDAPGRYVSRGKDSTQLLVGPLKMASVQGNPRVTYRFYMAAGRTDDHAAFALRRYDSLPFSSIYNQNGQDVEVTLEEGVRYFTLDTILRGLPAGPYSFYVTADDGEGESPASNIVTLELPPDPSEVISAPVIDTAFSPAIGLLVLRIPPLQVMGEGRNPALWFNVYRADGRTDNRDDFRLIPYFSGSNTPRNLLDTLPGAIREIAVTGLKGGEESFYVTVQIELGLDKKVLVSNIVTVPVMGSQASEIVSLRLTSVALPSSVSWSDITPGMGEALPFPNPATGLVHIPLPAGTGETMIRLFNAHGEEVLAFRSDAAAEASTLDLSSLPAGAYWARISRGGRSLVRGITITR